MKDMTPEEMILKIENQKEEIKNLRRALERRESQGAVIESLKNTLTERSLQLDALGWIWCHGACPGGYNRFCRAPELTEDLVHMTITHAIRVKRRFVNEHGSPSKVFRGIEDIYVKHKIVYVCPECFTPVTPDQYNSQNWVCDECGRQLTGTTLEQKEFTGPLLSYDKPRYLENEVENFETS